MSDAPAEVRIYLVTPPVFDDGLPGRVAGLLDAFDIACLRLALAAGGEDALARAADALRPVAHARDVPLVVGDHFRLAARLGLDGVHLSDGPRQVRAAREVLGKDGIVGAFARASRHDGLTAAEIGADYVSFGPVAASGLGDGAVAPAELFAWWTEMIEVPVVAEGGVTPEIARSLAGAVDFLAVGEEIWSASEGPDAALRAIIAALG